MQGIKLIVSVLALAFAIVTTPNKSLASPATNPDPTKPWGEFEFGGPGTFAEAGDNVFPSDGNNSFFLGIPPWTFTGSGTLIVQDAFFPGDQFRVFDNEVAIGDTSDPITSTIGCGSDPVDCFAVPGSSRGIFPLSAGNHSFTIQILLAPHFPEFLIGAAYFCIETGAGNCGVRTADIPEPGSMLLLGLGLAGALYWVKRPRLREVLLMIPRIRRKR